MKYSWILLRICPKFLFLYWLHLPLHFFRNYKIFENTFEIDLFLKIFEKIVKFRKYIRNKCIFRKYFRKFCNFTLWCETDFKNLSFVHLLCETLRGKRGLPRLVAWPAYGPLSASPTWTDSFPSGSEPNRLPQDTQIANSRLLQCLLKLD